MTNMVLHGIDAPTQIRRANALARAVADYQKKDLVDVVVTNPPFGGIEEDGIENSFPSAFRTRETADLFLYLLTVLLHDGGGDRSRTVLALPEIIEGAHARGLQIVPLHQLLGKSRADVMPPLRSNERWSAWLNLFGFPLFPVVSTGIAWMFFAGDILMTGRLLLVGAFALFDRLRQHRFGAPSATNRPSTIDRSRRAIATSPQG